MKNEKNAHKHPESESFIYFGDDNCRHVWFDLEPFKVKCVKCGRTVDLMALRDKRL